MTEFSEIYRGYMIRWIDWAPAGNGIALRAIWAAQKPGMEAFCYAVMPFGASGVCERTTNVLDVSLNNHWSIEPVTVFSSQELKDHWKDLGYKQLVVAIDHFIDVDKESIPKHQSNIDNELIKQWQEAMNRGKLIKNASAPYFQSPWIYTNPGTYSTPQITWTSGADIDTGQYGNITLSTGSLGQAQCTTKK